MSLSIASKRIQKLRDMIAAAERDGCAAADMLLRVTRGDASELKRNPSVAIHEISFAHGDMRFLGVKVVEGGVDASNLERAPA